MYDWTLIAWSTVLHVLDPAKPNKAFCGLFVGPGAPFPKRDGLEYKKCRNCQRMLTIKRITKEK